MVEKIKAWVMNEGRNQIGNTKPRGYQKLMLKICKRSRSSVVTVPPTRAARTPEYIDTKVRSKQKLRNQTSKESASRYIGKRGSEQFYLNKSKCKNIFIEV